MTSKDPEWSIHVNPTPIRRSSTEAGRGNGPSSCRAGLADVPGWVETMLSQPRVFTNDAPCPEQTNAQKTHWDAQ